MKKLLTLIFLMVLTVSMVGCSFTASLKDITDWIGDTTEKAVQNANSLLEDIGQTHLTNDNSLSGKRICTEEDPYVGTYITDCTNQNGKEILFGGASVKERKIKITATVKSVSGSAVFKVRIGFDVKEFQADENGQLLEEFLLNGGGNYIMIDYTDFTGQISLSSSYIE